MEHEIHQLMGEQNTFRYLPLRNILFRIQETDEFVEVLMIITAAQISKTPLFVSIDKSDSKLGMLQTFIKEEQVMTQNETEFIEYMQFYDRIRTCSSNLSAAIYEKAAELGLYIATQKPLMEGRLELLHYLKEQSISFEYHRYGSITEIPE